MHAQVSLRNKKDCRHTQTILDCMVYIKCIPPLAFFPNKSRSNRETNAISQFNIVRVLTCALKRMQYKHKSKSNLSSARYTSSQKHKLNVTRNFNCWPAGRPASQTHLCTMHMHEFILMNLMPFEWIRRTLLSI